MDLSYRLGGASRRVRMEAASAFLPAGVSGICPIVSRRRGE